MNTIVQQLSLSDIYGKTCDNYKSTQSYVKVLQLCMEAEDDARFKQYVSKDGYRVVKFIQSRHESWVRTMLEVSLFLFLYSLNFKGVEKYFQYYDDEDCLGSQTSAKSSNAQKHTSLSPLISTLTSVVQSPSCPTTVAVRVMSSVATEFTHNVSKGPS